MIFIVISFYSHELFRSFFIDYKFLMTHYQLINHFLKRLGLFHTSMSHVDPENHP